MDAVTIATAAIAAIAAGAAKGLGSKAAGEAYDKLKAKLKEKFAGSKTVKALEELEADSESEAYQMLLKEKMGQDKVNEDSDVQALAKELLDKLNQGQEGAVHVQQQASGNNIAQAGNNSSASVTVNK